MVYCIDITVERKCPQENCISKSFGKPMLYLFKSQRYTVYIVDALTKCFALGTHNGLEWSYFKDVKLSPKAITDQS